MTARPVPSPVLPEPPSVEIKFEDAQTVWNRDADRASAARAAYKDERRAEERAAEDLRRAGAVQADDLEARVSVLEQRMDDVEQAIASLANGSVGFSDAASERLLQLETLTTKLDATLSTLRGVHRREVENLRSQLSASETAHVSLRCSIAISRKPSGGYPKNICAQLVAAP